MGRRLFCENKKRLFGAMAVMFLIMAALGAIGYVFRIFYRGPDGWSLVNPFMGLWFTLILILLALDLFAGALFGGRKPTVCTHIFFLQNIIIFHSRKEIKNT